VQKRVMLLGGTSLCDVNLHTGCFYTKTNKANVSAVWGLHNTDCTSHIPASRVSSCALHKRLPTY
jgi:hypothetical protein